MAERSAAELYVVEVYGRVLHANFLYDADLDGFVARITEQAADMTDAEIESLLTYSNWRDRIVGAYLAGFGRRTALRDTIGALLLASDHIYAGQGYCFALAAFGEEADADWLAAFLDRWLRTSERYEQPWALGALMFIDPVRGVAYGPADSEHETICRLVSLVGARKS